MKLLLSLIILITTLKLHASIDLSPVNFCEQLSKSENKEKFLDENLYRLLSHYSTTSAHVAGQPLVLISGVSEFPKILSTQMYNSFKSFYDGNLTNRVLLLEELKNAKDVKECSKVINQKFIKTHMRLVQHKNNLNEVNEKSSKIEEIRTSANRNSQNLDCSEYKNPAVCLGIVEPLNTDEGITKVIEVVAPMALPGGYNKSCDCTNRFSLVTRNFNFFSNKQKKISSKNSAQAIIKKELFRKKFFELIDQHEKKQFLHFDKAMQLPAKLGCKDERLQESLNKTCKGRGVNNDLLNEVMSEYLSKNPRQHNMAQTIDDIETQIVNTQLRSKTCPGMSYNAYANLVKMDRGTQSNKFLNVYSILFNKINESKPVDYDDQFYDKAIKLVLASPDKFFVLKNALELSAEATAEETLDAFKLFHLQSTKNLGLKALLSSPKEIQMVMDNKNPSLIRMIDKISKPEVELNQCKQLMDEMAPFICEKSDDIDFDKYDIDINDLVLHSAEALSQDELLGLCLMRKENRKNKKLERVLFKDLPLEKLPDAAIYYDPLLANNDELKNTVMDIYTKNFCNQRVGVEADADETTSQMQQILSNPSQYSYYSGISDYMPDMQKIEHNFLSTVPLDSGGDNGRENFVSTSARDYQSNIITKPVILNTNQLEMKNYTSGGNVKAAVVNRAPASLNNIRDDEEKKERLVDQYRELDQDEADYFEKRKELLKQLYSSSDVPSSNLSEQDYLSKIKSLEDQLRDKESQLISINDISPKKTRVTELEGNQSAIDRGQGFVPINKQNDITPTKNLENDINDRSASYVGGSKSSFADDAQEGSQNRNNINHIRNDGLYLNITASDYSNPEFIKSMETQIKILMTTDIDKLIQQLEKGPLLLDVDGKKVGLNVDDLKKILDAETIKKIEVKLALAKKNKVNISPNKLQSIVKNAKVESEIKEIKSEMYKTLLQLSSKLKSQGKI